LSVGGTGWQWVPLDVLKKVNFRATAIQVDHLPRP